MVSVVSNKSHLNSGKDISRKTTIAICQNWTHLVFALSLCSTYIITNSNKNIAPV